MEGISFQDFEDAKLSDLYRENFANARDLATGWRDIEISNAIPSQVNRKHAVPGDRDRRERPARAIGGGHSNVERREEQHYLGDQQSRGQIENHDRRPARHLRPQDYGVPANRMLNVSASRGHQGHRSASTGQLQESVQAGGHAAEDFMRAMADKAETGGCQQIGSQRTSTDKVPSRATAAWKPSSELRALGNVSARAPPTERTVQPASSGRGGGGDKGAFIGWTSN